MYELTYAGVVVLDVQKVSAAGALVTTPCILATAFRALTSFLLLTFVNIYTWNKKISQGIKLFRKSDL